LAVERNCNVHVLSIVGGFGQPDWPSSVTFVLLLVNLSTIHTPFSMLFQHPIRFDPLGPQKSYLWHVISELHGWAGKVTVIIP
jgi:hypothetical protein